MSNYIDFGGDENKGEEIENPQNQQLIFNETRTILNDNVVDKSDQIGGDDINNVDVLDTKDNERRIIDVDVNDEKKKEETLTI